MILLLFAFSAFAQNPRPTPAPDEDSDVIKISTSLIQIDVTVTDKKGSIVKDLKPSDFEIFENGVRQEIKNFSFISSIKTENEKKKREKNSVPFPRTEIRPEQVRRTIALVVDDLSLSFESVHFVRRALKKFVDEQMQDGDLVAIIRTGANVGALQQFTSDKRLLYAAIENVRWNSLGKGGISPFKPLGSDGFSEEEEENEESSQTGSNDPDAFRNEILISGSLGTLRYIIEGMSEMPGRKSVLYLSDGFALFSQNAEGMTEATETLNAVRRVIDAAYRSSVVIYALDARGLQSAGITAADNVRSASEIDSATSSRRAELFNTREGLVFLAEQTGGFAVTNNNDIVGGFRKVLDDQSYYLIGYQPDDETFDPKQRRFNKLEVRVNRKDVTVRYRSGFFNVSEEKKIKPAVAQTPVQQLADALISPFTANDISLRLNALFGNNPNGAFVRSLLHINTRDLKFEKQTDGSYKTSFDVLAMSFGDNGNPVEQLGQTFNLTVPSAEYERILNAGAVYYFTFPIKNPGAYQLRVALRDSQTGKIGSASQFIEIPNLKKKRLTLSGIVLENLTEAQWNQLAGSASNSAETKDNRVIEATNPMNDTSLRRFKRGTILRYAFEVYNSDAEAARNANLTMQIRVFHDGRMILEGKQKTLDARGQIDPQRLKSTGAIDLTEKMEFGEYILQIIVTDNSVKGKRRTASQFVQFEIAE